MSFLSILAKYRKVSFSEKDKGDRFERLMQAYLKTDPKWTNTFRKVWLWSEFPGKNDLGGSDTGIDLVGLTHEGDYWAIQCKCYAESTTIDKPAVDSFLATSSREFMGEDLKTTRFHHRLWISTTNKWGPNAVQAIQNQRPPVSRLNLYELIEAPVDWEKLEQGIHGEQAQRPKKNLFPHQKEAVEKTHEYLKSADRGKLIMACGTGKTFTALRIAENETEGKGLVLFLVPSISLLGQSLREWYGDANERINAICICSDPEVSRTRSKNDDSDSTSVVDLALPASTDKANILRQFRQLKETAQPGMTVVFSTYQSIEVIARAQQEIMKNGFPEFDLIICDEAHRTTGVTLAGEDESAFTKVHDNNFIRAKKRIYMTATPRLYNDDSKSRAAQADAVLCSMDDENLYGNEIYRIGFGEAVDRSLLTDYKVLILTLSDKDIPPAVQNMIAGKEKEIDTDDISKLIGCVNALSKQFIGDHDKTRESDPEPMRRAVAFCSSIATSKKISAIYNTATDTYIKTLPAEQQEKMVAVESRHIDGKHSAPERDEMLSWLKSSTDGNTCRVLTNVRCLSEGVDVPSLDAVLFLSPRNSQVDVVQSVGRVMRKAPGKKYGYIIIPVIVPSDVEAEVALDNNERYRVVWTVLNALRAHDDRFNATVNKIELNKTRPEQILVGRPSYSFDDEGRPWDLNEEHPGVATTKDISSQLSLQFEQLQNVVFARMVQKVGDKRYWEQWAKDVAVIAERQVERIHALIERKGEQQEAFEKFLSGLQKNINPSIDKNQAVDMLAQHIITRPIFDALFEGYSFVKHNAVSTAMQGMLDALEGQTMEAESEKLQKFYDSVRKRAEGIDNAEGKQRIIIELYDKFFRTAFPKMVEQLGIVYTPVEVVDFILHSVDDVLKQEFGRSLSDENIHILDPFTGTGTFITRLLQSGLIKQKDLVRKYHHELHANEIVLLAYYIAAVNIENAYHDLFDASQPYSPFEGIVLTDTFQLGETDESERLFSEMFVQNSARVARQKKAPLRVIMGNPPYSVGQKSANDNAQNQKYVKLEARVAATYAKGSSATSVKALYDAYIKAFRWSTDRLDPKNGGVIAFVSNGAWLEGNGMDGFRKSLEKEFSSIWVFNLRGNARTQGALRQKEAGNVFGSGSRTPISITLLVKNPESKAEKATIRYCDVGDYLRQEEKLKVISNAKSFMDPQLKFIALQPNEYGDWIKVRNDVFSTFNPIESSVKFELGSKSIFVTHSLGIATSRDAWVMNFSKRRLASNVCDMIDFYNLQKDQYKVQLKIDSRTKFDDFASSDKTKISWNDSLKDMCSKGTEITYDEEYLRVAIYRPFNKVNLYFDKRLIQRPYQTPKLLPTSSHENMLICVTGTGGSKDFSPMITNCIPNLHLVENGQCFPLVYYEASNTAQQYLFDDSSEMLFTAREAISNHILTLAKKLYGSSVVKRDIFFYVYAFLHSPDYLNTFSDDLKKMLPRLPLVEDVKDFWAFSKAGGKLADLHINYESVPPHPDVVVTGAEKGFFKVEKMRFPKKGQKDTIIYNSAITVSNIPAEAYDYVINGKSAIDWIMERYQITTHKESGIVNDPNDWSEEVGNPRYILDLLLSVIHVSTQTVEIVKGLPRVRFE